MLGEEGPAFDIQGLLESLSGASIERVRTEFEQKYVPWAKMDAETSVRRINSIFRVLNRFAIQNCAQLVVPPTCQFEWSSTRRKRKHAYNDCSSRTATTEKLKAPSPSNQHIGNLLCRLPPPSRDYLLK